MESQSGKLDEYTEHAKSGFESPGIAIARAHEDAWRIEVDAYVTERVYSAPTPAEHRQTIDCTDSGRCLHSAVSD
jgi:hypothetical protein